VDSFINEFVRSNIEIIGKLVISVFVLIIANLLARYIKGIIKKADDHLDAITLSEHSLRLTSNAAKYAIYACAFTVIIVIFDLTPILYPLLTGGAILGFAIGYASKEVLSNMLSGIMLAVDKHFRVGDQVRVAGVEGIVRDIKLRVTRIRTFDGLDVWVPNSMITSQSITNYTVKKRRIEIPLVVNYQSDLKKVIGTIKKITDANELILQNPKPAITLRDIKSNINLELYVWVNADDYDKVSDGLKEKIVEEFIKNDIRISA